MSYSSKKRPFHLTTPLAEDVLLLHRFEGDEALSQPFEFRLSIVSEDDAIDAKDLVGKRITLWANRDDAQEDDSDECWSGIVTTFGRTGSQWFAGAGDMQELTTYEAVLVPWFWQLKLVENCRIFQNMSIPDIVDAILGELQLGKHETDLSGSYPPLEYCVQYGESSFDFIARLLEDAGIHYFFKHDPKEPADVLVITDHQEKDYKGQVATLRYAANWAEQDEPVVFALERRQRMRTGHVTMRDFDFTKPTQNLEAGVDTVLTVGAQKAFQSFRYPGGYLERSDGDQRVKLAMEIEEAGHELLDGASMRLEIHPGMAFQLDDPPNDMLKPAWRTLRARHRGENNLDDDNGESYYQNDFTVIPLAMPYRPPRDTPRPRMRGPQTAIVTGPPGEEIYTDQYGRVKVHFFWDHLGSSDDKSSCWMRVSQTWAGRGWGTFFLPRIGMEVIVDFLEGDPNQPLITGCVYNGDNTTPYALPGEMTKSTLKSWSTKGGDGFNEIRFEDKKGGEQLFTHAERNQDVRVKNDSMEWIGKDRHLIVAGDQLEKVTGDKHLTIAGDQNEKIDGTVSLNAGTNLQQKVGSNAALDAGTEIHLKAGTNLVIESGTTLTLKVGGNFIMISSAGITMVGSPMVMINSGGSPGTGSGSSPTAPKDPTEADDAKPGEAMKPPPPADPPPPAASPQAGVLKDAAKSGAPFCEKCEAARKAQAAGQT